MKSSVLTMRKSKSVHKPLRTSKEMAKEFNIKLGQLSYYLGAYDGPKCRFRADGKNNENTWHDPTEMRRWWKSIQDKIK